jgi:hypothetical protein
MGGLDLRGSGQGQAVGCFNGKERSGSIKCG